MEFTSLSADGDDHQEVTWRGHGKEVRSLSDSRFKEVVQVNLSIPKYSHYIYPCSNHLCQSYTSWYHSLSRSEPFEYEDWEPSKFESWSFSSLCKIPVQSNAEGAHLLPSIHWCSTTTKQIVTSNLDTLQTRPLAEISPLLPTSCISSVSCFDSYAQAFDTSQCSRFHSSSHVVSPVHFAFFSKMFRITRS